MKIASSLILGSALALAATSGAQAADKGAEVGSFGIGIGTNGTGVDFAYPVNSYIDLRAGYDFGSLSEKRTEEGIEYKAKLKFSGGRFLLDLKPFAGGFRISGGLYTKAPELDLKANGQDEYEIGDTTYNGDLKLDGNIDLGKSAPYLGLGWGGTAGTTGFGVSFDIGVMFADSPKVLLDVAGRACDQAGPGGESCDPNDPAQGGFDVNDASADPVVAARVQEFQMQKEAERKELEDKGKDYDMWPIIRLGLHYRF